MTRHKDWKAADRAWAAGRERVAVRLLRNHLSTEPGDVRRWILLGLWLEDMGDTDGAIEAARVALSSADSSQIRAKCHAFVGRLLDDVGDFDEAITQLESALVSTDSDAGDRADNLILLGSAQAHAGRFDQSKISFRSACEIAPDSEEAAYNFGIALRRENSGLAVAHFRDALTRFPDSERCVRALAISYFVLGEQSTAIRIIEENLGNPSPTTRGVYAYIVLRSGDNRLARKVLGTPPRARDLIYDWCRVTVLEGSRELHDEWHSNFSIQVGQSHGKGYQLLHLLIEFNERKAAIRALKVAPRHFVEIYADWLRAVKLM